MMMKNVVSESNSSLHKMITLCDFDSFRRPKVSLNQDFAVVQPIGLLDLCFLTFLDIE